MLCGHPGAIIFHGQRSHARGGEVYPHSDRGAGASVVQCVVNQVVQRFAQQQGVAQHAELLLAFIPQVNARSQGLGGPFAGHFAGQLRQVQRLHGHVAF